MNQNRKTEIGDKFGYLEIVAYERSSSGACHSLCLCICGKVKSIRTFSITSGATTSCGCKQTETISLKATTYKNSKHILWGRFADMHRRCKSKSRKDYIHYGGRGIYVCDEWNYSDQGFEKFMGDFGKLFVEGLEIERIDNNGNYCKDNCKWATRKDQTRNTRKNTYITWNGETRVLVEWAEILEISQRVLIDRLGKLNWSIEKAFTTKVGEIKSGPKKKIKGETDD